jgi:MFS family permease
VSAPGLAVADERGSTSAREWPPAWLSWSVWAVAATFYLTGFYLRVSPAVMTAELMRDLGIGGRDLGTLSAFYFYAYVLMQLPTGVLVDSWGARKLLIAGSLTAAGGAFLFAAAPGLFFACLGRALVGGGTAVGWVVTLKLATHWFPARRFAVLSGLGLLFGNLGALFAQVPLRLLVETYGWRAIAFGSAAVILGVGGLALALVQNDPAARGFQGYAPPALQQRDPVTLSQLLRGFRQLWAYRNTWLIFFAQGGFVGAVLAFTGLWGPPYLSARYGLTAKEAAGVCSIMIVCWAAASPICGYLSDRIGLRRPIYLGGAILAAIGWAVLFYAPGLPLSAFRGVAAVTSFACGAVILGFAYAKESVPVRFLGTTSALVNVGNMLGPMLLQPGIGWLLDRSGPARGALRVYGVEAFQSAFLLIVAWSVLSCLLIALTRETRCRQLEA